jgi:hypothetical protein
MSLAWSNLNRTTPDLNAAEQDAQAALKMVPFWHYVRDILIPQIRAAQAKALLPVVGSALGQTQTRVCQVFCVNDLDFVLGFGFVVALAFAVVVG